MVTNLTVSGRGPIDTNTSNFYISIIVHIREVVKPGGWSSPVSWRFPLFEAATDFSLFNTIS